MDVFAAATIFCSGFGVTDLVHQSSSDSVLDLSTREIVSRAAHLLWVIARCDVENLLAHRQIVLDQLRDLENAATRFGILDLYQAVLQL